MNERFSNTDPIKDVIEKGTIDELVKFSKQYGIHQSSTNRYYLSNVAKIKQKLTEAGIDPDSI